MNPIKAFFKHLFETNEQTRDRIVAELADLKAQDKATHRSSVTLPKANDAYLARWQKIGKLEKQLAEVKAKILRSSAPSAEHSKA